VITIAHTHATGTVVHGATRDDGTGTVILSVPDSWRFSRTIGVEGAWHLPRSRDRDALQPVIDRLATALRAAGYEVQVSIDNTPRPAGDIEADRVGRVAARVARYTARATARHAAGGARLARVEQRRQAIPPGQPVINDRYGGFLTRLNRAEAAARAELATGDYWQHRTQAATSTQWYRHRPRSMVRRIERLDAELRRWQRTRDALDPTEGDGLAETDAQIARLVGQLAFWRGELATLEAAGVFRLWSADDFRRGDEARILDTWYPVVRVNAKSLTVELANRAGLHEPAVSRRRTGSSPYDNVYGRRRDGIDLHSPPPAEGATCTCRIIIPTFNAEFVPERDGGPCTEPPVARLTIRHDGTTCGCHGVCVDPDLNSGEAEAWTEVVLFCTGHADEHRADIAAAVASEMAIVEDLS
jgi:hypothetical protein